MSVEIKWITLPFMRIIEYEKGKDCWNKDDYPDEPCGFINAPYVYVSGMTSNEQRLAGMKVRDILIDDWMRLGKLERARDKKNAMEEQHRLNMSKLNNVVLARDKVITVNPANRNPAKVIRHNVLARLGQDDFIPETRRTK